MAGLVKTTIAVREDLYRQAVVALNPDQLRRALFRAVKRATDRGTNIVQKRVRQVVRIEGKYLERAIRSRLEVRDPLPPIGHVTISQVSLPAIAYKPTGGGMMTPAGKGGVRFKPWKDKKARVFRHGFVATVNYQNAHTPAELHRGVFIRTRHATPNPKAGRLTPKGFAGRLAIKQLMGPSLHTVIDVPKVTQGIVDDMGETLEKTLRERINTFGSGVIQ